MPELTASVGIRGASFLGNRIDVSYDASAIHFTVQPLPSAAEAEASAAEAARGSLRTYACPCALRADAAAEQGGYASAAAARAACLAALGSAKELAHLSLAPRTPLAARAQRGRIVLSGGHIVAAQPLQLVDAMGKAQPLVAGVTVTLPLQPAHIVAAA